MNLLLKLAFVLSLFPTIIFAQTADKVFKNAKVYIGNSTFTEAIAVQGDKLIYVGTDAGVQAHIGSNTYVEDLSGKLMLPGMHDVHQHPLEAGSPIGGDCLLKSNASDPEFLKQELQECNLTANANGWITAFGHSIFTFFEANNARYPYQILDDVYPNTPAVVMEETSHSVWVNSAALSLLGINANTTDPVGGHIVKDATNSNRPTGILLDNAGDVALAAAFVPNPSIDAQNKAGLVEYSLPLLAQNGITSICEGRTYWKRNYHQIWQSIKADGDLTCRVVLAPWVYPSDADASLITELTALYDEGDDYLRSTQIKLYSDGILINATAAMQEPYDYNWDLPFDKGLNYIDEIRLTNFITQLETIGYDFHIHAIGDRGIKESLNAIESARNTNGNVSARHRITHLEIVKPADINRFAGLNVTADMQVAGAFTNPANWSDNDDFIGANRSQNIIPLKSFYDAGARVTLSSDWDVSSVNPFVGIQNALTRAPQNLPNLDAAIKAYTLDAAYVMRQEDKTGSLEVGKFADFIVVNKDIFNIPTNQINTTKTVLTYVGGEEVYRLGGSLPVELKYFEVKNADCTVTLEWATSAEVANATFIIERSTNGKYFSEIGSLKGQGTDYSETVYIFADENPYDRAFYRLKQIDENGREEVSHLIPAQKRCAKELTARLTPNRVSSVAWLRLEGEQSANVLVELFANHGQLVKQFSLSHDQFVSQRPINVAFLPEGFYYLKLSSTENAWQKTLPMVVVK